MSRGEEHLLISNWMAQLVAGASRSTRLSRRKGIEESLNEQAAYRTIVVQHPRLDSNQPEDALITFAFAGNE
jgi:hypothetical protein